MSDFKIGDTVFGVDGKAEMPRNGGIIARIIIPDYYYVNHIAGGGIGMRDAKELKGER